MNNERGYVTVGTIVVILILTSMYLVIFFGKILNTSNQVAQSSLISDEIVKDSNGKERLYSLLRSNVSFEGEVIYEDLERQYEVETINETYEPIVIHTNPHNSSTFNINNKTPIDVEFTVMGEDCLYSAELLINDKDLLNGMASNLNSGFSTTINEKELYNIETGEVNYGDLKINFPKLNNCTIFIELNYNKLIEREVAIKGDFNRQIVIDNQSNTIRYKEGGY